nr:glycine-rich protein DC7.1-like [Rhipicephalus microplus]
MKSSLFVFFGVLVVTSLVLCQDEETAAADLQVELNDAPSMSRVRRGGGGGGGGGGKGKGKGGEKSKGKGGAGGGGHSD